MNRWQFDGISYELRARRDGTTLLQTELWRCDNELLLATIDRFEQDQGIKLLALQEQIPMELLLNYMNASKEAFAEAPPVSQAIPYATPEVVQPAVANPEAAALGQAVVAIAVALGGMMLIGLLLALILAVIFA